MKKERTRRQRAILRRNLFLAACTVVLVLLILLIVEVIRWIGGEKAGEKPQDTGSVTSADVTPEQPVADTRPQFVTRGNHTLDATYTELMIVNAKNPLPDDYSIESELVEIDPKYRNNNNVYRIHKNVYPYIQAMVEAAQNDGVDLKVWSPYRSRSVQQTLFQNQVNRQLANGVPADQAEEKAATIVARPGTSEHETGLAADFNRADDAFEKTPMYAWMQEHAADYGFIMRYTREKQPITGVIHESWHYRFVGIYTAQEIKASGLCLEEFVAQKK
ncbi:MAG: M15 family metallopeptidase [Clostridia bacterium]|nr:M15 family metallopeptidase [Clostridia bacterium]